MRPFLFRKTSQSSGRLSRRAMPWIMLSTGALLLLFAICLAADSRVFDKSKILNRRHAQGFAAVPKIAGNGAYEMVIEPVIGRGVGLYSVRTGPTHPITQFFAKQDLENPKQDLLVGASNDESGTSYTTIRSYRSKIDYVQSEFAVSDSGFTTIWLDTTFVNETNEDEFDFDVVKAITSGLDTTGYSITYTVPGVARLAAQEIFPNPLEITQIINTHGNGFDDSWVEVSTVVKNVGLATDTIGIRYLWDLIVAGDDGPVLMNRSFKPFGNFENSFSNPNFDFYVAADTNVITQQAYNVYGSALTPSNLLHSPFQPERLQLVSWLLAFFKAFSYQIHDSLDVTTHADPNAGAFGGDNAIQYYWGETRETALVLQPNDSIKVTQVLIATLPGERPPVLDFDAPSCEIDKINPGPPKSIEVVLQDLESGLRFIRTINDFNVSVSVPHFEIGTTEPVRAIYTVIDQAQPFAFTVKAMDVSGNIVTCDPIFLTLMPELRIFEYRVEPIYADRYFYIKNQGIQRIVVDLNGHAFTLSAEGADQLTGANVFRMPLNGDMTIDILRYLKEDGNTMIIAFDGPLGSRADLIISDMLLKGNVDLILDLTPLPEQFALRQNLPNPFRGETTIRFDVPTSATDFTGGRVELKIYNLLGQLVRTLRDANLPPGSHVAEWDGRDEAGRRVAAGVYLYRLHANGATLTKKLALLR